MGWWTRTALSYHLVLYALYEHSKREPRDIEFRWFDLKYFTDDDDTKAQQMGLLGIDIKISNNRVRGVLAFVTD